MTFYSKFCMCVLSWVQLFETPCPVACQAYLSMECSRQEYYRGLPFPAPGELPDPGMDPSCLMLPVLEGRFFTTRATWEAPIYKFSYWLFFDAEYRWAVILLKITTMIVIRWRQKSAHSYFSCCWKNFKKV